MPAAKVEFDHRDKSLNRVVNVGYGQEHFRMAHETVGLPLVVTCAMRNRSEAGTLDVQSRGEMPGDHYFVMRSSMLRGSRIKVGRTTLLRSAPGRSCCMMCMSTAASSVSTVKRKTG